jgi:hypothetical protein
LTVGDKNDNPAVREATGAFIQSLLDATLPAIREAARFQGYAVAVHGSLMRDIDLIAVAWTEQARPAPKLVEAICGAVGGVLGNCFVLSQLGEKPHGRLSCTLVHPGFAGEIDLSVIPPLPQAEASEKP